MAAPKPRRLAFRTQAALPRLQPFPVFPDFLEEVRSSWNHPALAPSVVKWAAPLASCVLGLAEFPPVDSTIMALVQGPPVGGVPKDPACPYGQWKVTETHLKKAYAAEAQVTCLANMAGLLMVYLDGILQSATLPEPVASELCLILSMLLLVSDFQRQALGRSLASLVVVHRQFWLSQARVPDEDKSALLDMRISPCYTFGPAVEETLQLTHQEHESSRQIASMLPSSTLVQERTKSWRPPVTPTEAFRLPRQLIARPTRNDGRAPDVGSQCNTAPEGSSNATPGSPRSGPCPSLNSPSRAPEGLLLQNQSCTQHQLQY
ncbi:UNVERIFIED_CONTAM: hypothetical protein FKN15_004845 [Acipenser sinensis]